MSIKSLLIKQFCVDLRLTEDELSNEKHIFTTGKATSDSRYWARESMIILYKDRILCRTDNPQLTSTLEKTYKDSDGAWFLEVDNVNKLEEILKEYDYKIKSFAPFFIPINQNEYAITDPHLRFYQQDEIFQFEGDQRFRESFAFSETDPDMVAVSYIVDEEIVAMAGASQNGKYTWEIGVEVVQSNYQSKGIATLLVKALTQRIFEETNGEIFPTYGTAFSHTKSMNVAIQSGYKVGWTEIMIEKL